jgi:aerobic carbon-monoxide dehydrogenase medium subunit
MKPADFTLHRPRTLDEALEVMASADSVKPLAGGQSLVPLLNFRLARPEHLVDLDGLARLSELRRTPARLEIGAMVRQRRAERSRAVAADCPLFAAALPWVAHPPIRNRGTVGGSIAHADPAAELPAVVRALDATLRAASVRGTREIAAAEFFRTHLTTALEPDELLVQIDVPRAPARTGAAYLEVSRRHGDFALAGAAVQVTLGSSGAIDDARICLSGVAETPHRCTGAERLLVGRHLDAGLAAAAADSAREDLEPTSDLHASADYRRDVAGTLVERALPRAVAAAAERDGTHAREDAA